MHPTGAAADTTPAALESAGFVWLLARPDADSLAGAGLLARALGDRGIPFQVSVTDRRERDERANANTRAADADADVGGDEDDDLTIALGPTDAAVTTLDPADGPLSVQAAALVGAIGDRPDPVLAHVGAVTSGFDPGLSLDDESVDIRPLESRPGVGVPTDDPVDGLAHSTLVRAAWSGDPDAVAEAIGGAEGQELASLVAIDAVGAPDASARAGATLDRFLHPQVTPDGPFATVAGTADVLAATARMAPGVGVALALGHDVTDAALDVWREHAIAVHAAIDGVTTHRYDGLFALDLAADAPAPARTDAIESVARLAAATTTPEPLVLVVGDGVAALASTSVAMVDGSKRDGATTARGAATDDASAADATIGSYCRALASELGGVADYGVVAGTVTTSDDHDAESVVDATRGCL